MPTTATLAAALVECENVEPELSEFIASHVMDSVQWDANGQPSRPVADVVAQLRAGFPFAFRKGAAPIASVPTDETVTARVVRESRERTETMDPVDPWRNATVTMRVLREAGRR